MSPMSPLASIVGCFNFRETEVRRMAFCRRLPEHFHQDGPITVRHTKDPVGDLSKRFGQIPRLPSFAGGVDAERIALVSGERERQEIPRYDHGAPLSIPPSLYERARLIYRRSGPVDELGSVGQKAGHADVVQNCGSQVAPLFKSPQAGYRWSLWAAGVQPASDAADPGREEKAAAL